MSRRRVLATGVAVSVVLAGCSGGSDDDAATPGTRSTATASSSASSGSSSSSSGTARPGSASSAPTKPGASPTGTSCVTRLVEQLTPQQRAGQLVMVGLQTGGGATSVDRAVRERHVGNVFFIGGWYDGAGSIRSVTSHVQSLATPEATGGVRFLVAADQEGGEVQQLRGEGFTRLASALDIGGRTPQQRRDNGETIGRQLKAVGVNIDLAPVADVVPPENPTANQAIGRWSREYGHDPESVSAAVVDVVTGMQSHGVAATLKHFPGLGRVQQNTDHSATGISDEQTTADDAYLQPFAKGVAAHPGMVMMSSATYPRIDPSSPAVFSPKVVQNVLRDRLHWDGVVVTDDLNAVALRSTPPGERALRFLRAGGDIALTGSVNDAEVMAQAIESAGSHDPAFEKRVRESVTRVLGLKTRMGLTTCSS